MPDIKIIGFVSSISTPLYPPMDDPIINSFMHVAVGFNRAQLKNKTKIKSEYCYWFLLLIG